MRDGSSWPTAAPGQWHDEAVGHGTAAAVRHGSDIGDPRYGCQQYSALRCPTPHEERSEFAIERRAISAVDDDRQ